MDMSATSRRYSISLPEEQCEFECVEGESVLAAMQRAALTTIRVGCRNGGCGICRIQVLSGAYSCGLMSGAQISNADRATGVVLACRTFPEGDLACRPIGRSLTGQTSGRTSDT